MGLGAAHAVPSLLTTVCTAQSTSTAALLLGALCPYPPEQPTYSDQSTNMREMQSWVGLPWVSRGTFLASVWTHHPGFGVWLPLGMK